LSRPPIHKQMKDVDDAIAEYPEYKNVLTLHLAILKIREHVEVMPTKGTNIRWDKGLPTDLRQHLYSKRKTAVKFLTASMFDEEIAIDVCKKVIHTLSRHGIGGKNLLKVSGALTRGEIEITDSLEAIMKEKSEWFEEQGRRFEVDSRLLRYVFGIPIQPCLEEITRKLDTSFLEQWWQPSCPVCGGIPQIAWLGKQKRYLTCSFCGAKYLADMFLCANCGNTEPYTLGYLKPRDKPWFKVDFCKKCKHYIKIIDGDKLKRKIPQGLEDILTHSLDRMIRKALTET
jgi:FdhE protein